MAYKMYLEAAKKSAGTSRKKFAANCGKFTERR